MGAWPEWDTRPSALAASDQTARYMDHATDPMVDAVFVRGVLSAPKRGGTPARDHETRVSARAMVAVLAGGAAIEPEVWSPVYVENRVQRPGSSTPSEHPPRFGEVLSWYLVHPHHSPLFLIGGL
jgi:hypothetical protein